MNQSSTKGLLSNKDMFNVFKPANGAIDPMYVGDNNHSEKDRNGQTYLSTQSKPIFLLTPIGKPKTRVKNYKGLHHHLRIRPADDVASQRSTLTFYQSSYPSATAQIVAKNYNDVLPDSKTRENFRKR